MPKPTESRPHVAVRLFVFQLLMATLTLLVAVAHPYADPIDETSHLEIAPLYGWVFVQAYCLTLPGFLAGIGLSRLRPAAGAKLGAVAMAAAPVVVLGDVLAFNWLGERLFSQTTHHILTALLPSLLIHLTLPLTVAGIGLLVVALGLLLMCWKLAGRVAGRVRTEDQKAQPLKTGLVALILIGGLLFMPLKHLERTIEEMHATSDRHPFCAVRLVGYHGVGLPVPTGEGLVRGKLQGLHFVSDAYRHDDAFHAMSLLDAGATRPDILLVIVESLRHELVEPEVMPNIHALAQEGLWCRSHFATINSTNASVFSMLNGIEGVWFERYGREQPLAARLFQQAGYEVGFFGGHDDGFEHYHMDGFLKPAWYDAFHTTEHGWVETDRESVARVERFFDRDRPGASDKPKLAILYYFSTHFDYQGDPEDAIFLPMVEHGGIPPYPAHLRDKEWNRYKNAARTMDKVVAPLLDRDRIIVVAGDHGEAFLEDGCCSHGLRVSKVQSMTPGIVYIPEIEPRAIDSLTNHADFLPTLIAATGMEVSERDLFDGQNLLAPKLDEERVFLTRNYIDSTAGIIGPWTLDPRQPFAYRSWVSVTDWQALAMNAVDERGQEYAATGDTGAPTAETALRLWSRQQFPGAGDFWDDSPVEMLTRHLTSQHLETRLAALTLAADTPLAVEPQVIEIVTEATKSELAAERELAREALIHIQRRSAP